MATIIGRSFNLQQSYVDHCFENMAWEDEIEDESDLEIFTILSGSEDQDMIFSLDGREGVVSHEMFFEFDC